jgi:hypothetical protein
MPTYSKAYLLADLRKFPGWTSCAVEKAGLNTYGGNGGTLSAEDTDANNDVAYVMESLKVTVNPVNLDSQGDWILTKVSPEWEAFCKNELKFEAGLLNISGVQGVQLSPLGVFLRTSIQSVWCTLAATFRFPPNFELLAEKTLRPRFKVPDWAEESQRLRAQKASPAASSSTCR